MGGGGRRAQECRGLPTAAAALGPEPTSGSSTPQGCPLRARPAQGSPQVITWPCLLSLSCLHGWVESTTASQGEESVGS